MSLLTRLVPNFLRSTAMGLPSTSLAPAAVPAGSIFGQSIRTMIRNHFPRASERKRVKRHGFNKRMSTADGRRTLMRKMLKGRFVISH